MRYRNIKTGVIVDIPSRVSSSSWECLDIPKNEKPVESEVPKKRATKRKEE